MNKCLLRINNYKNIFEGIKMRYFVIIFLFISSNLFSQSAYEFLKLDPSARSAALGGAFVSNVDDPNVIFYNPASTNQVESNKISFGFLKHLLDVNSGFISYIPHIKNIGKIGFGIAFSNYGSFEVLDEFGNSSGEFSANDLAIMFNYSDKVREKLSYGFNFKFIYSGIHKYSSYAIAGDFGLIYYNPEKQFNFGLSILNFGKQLKAYNQYKENLPVDVRLGLSKKLEHTPFRIYFEFLKLNQPNSKIFSRFNNFIIGTEILASSNLTLRVGFNNEKRKEFKIGTTTGTEGFSIGLGLNIRNYRFDYGLSSLGKVGALHRVNLTLTL